MVGLMQFWLRKNKNKNVVKDEIVVEEEEDFANFEECENWVLHLKRMPNPFCVLTICVLEICS